MLRCNLTKSRELELIILMSLMTLLDKSNDGGWKRDPISKGVQDDITNSSNNSSNNNSFVSPPSASTIANTAANAADYYEDPIPKKSQQKKHKVELLNDQKLQLMLEKDVRRSQKQIQYDQKNHKPSLSAGNSPAHTPKTSPLPTPSTSTNVMNNILSPRLSHQKSAALLTNATTSNVSDSSLSPTSPTSSNHSSGTNNGAGRLSRLFNTLSQMKQTNDMVIITPDDSTTASPADDFNKLYHHANDSQTKKQQQQQMHQKQILRDQKLKLQRQKQHQQQQQQQLLYQQAQMDQEYYEQHHLSLPTGQLSRFTNEFGNMSINNSTHENPPSLRNIRWNPEPLVPIETTTASTTNKYISSRIPQQQQQIHYQHVPSHRSNSNSRRPRMEDQQRRLSATEYSIYYRGNQPQQPQYNNNYNNRYSTSEYYTHPYQQQQPVYDYYQ